MAEEKITKWKSVLWKKDAEIDWSQYTDKKLVEYVETGTSYEPIEADGYVTKKVNGEDVRESVCKVVKQTEGFQAYHKTPFDYQQLSNELKRRGYEQHWVKMGKNNSTEEEEVGNSDGIKGYASRAIVKNGDVEYVKLPVYKETEELISKTFGHLKKGIKGVVIAQVLYELLREKFGE